MGFGVRTLHDMFSLSKINPTSSELSPLAGDALEAFTAGLYGVRVLIIDEVSMVSRLVIAQVSSRLQEWRHQTGRPGRNLPFEGLGVILAGDFGQLPPVNIPVTHALLNQNVLHGPKEARSLNAGLRIFNQFAWSFGFVGSTDRRACLCTRNR